jgi:Transposase
MPRPKKYPDELMDHGVRLVFESKRPIAQVARDLGVGAEALRLRVRRAEADSGPRPEMLSTAGVKLAPLAFNTLTVSRFGHLVNAPIEWIDLADWLTNLTNSEYRRLYPGAHIAAGTGPTEDGERISIHVEMIGESLLVHQDVSELIGRRNCRMASVSDVFTALEQTTARVQWELSVEPLDEHSCEHANRLSAIATDQLPSFIEAHGIGVEAAAGAYAEAFETHNELETASLAASIERRARLCRDLNLTVGVHGGRSRPLIVPVTRLGERGATRCATLCRAS